MTDKERQETLKRLKARLECDKRQVRGNADICNPPYMCEECDLCYAQGTLGERNIDLARAIEALSVEAITIEQLLSILPKYDDYIHLKTYPYNETMEDVYSKGHEDGWNVCLKIIKEELDYWEKENEID